jgi:cytochrome c oxidase assembly protein subunit 15
MRRRITLNPQQFRTAAWVDLILLTVIVFSGAAVRLTDSGLGCATWPHCDSRHIYPPDQLHALIEFSNRSLSGIVGLVTIAVMVLAFYRKPFRRDLAVLAALMPLGVAAQAVLGGITVREKLAPGFVMSHFSLSMIIIIGAVMLVWRSYHAVGARPRAASRGLVFAVRLSVVLGAITIFAGTVATASGPHSGGHVGQVIKRLHFKGADTLLWAIHQHATVAVLFGLVTIGAWLLKRREFGTLEPTEPLTILGILIAAQGLVGSVQYELHLPAEMVWVHVVLAAITWVVALWAWADIGRAVPRRRHTGDLGPDTGVAESRELEVARL